MKYFLHDGTLAAAWPRSLEGIAGDRDSPRGPADRPGRGQAEQVPSAGGAGVRDGLLHRRL